MSKNVSQEVKAAGAEIDLAKNKYRLEMQTSAGPIVLEFFPDVAPGHVLNMLALAKIGFYDNLTFHRVIKGFMIQGGCPEGTGMGGPGYNIKAEFNSCKHVAGVLSMARSSDPDSAGSQFFLCLDQASYLDEQYTAFGKTADEESLATVKKIGEVETDANDCPLEPVAIVSVTVLEEAL